MNTFIQALVFFSLFMASTTMSAEDLAQQQPNNVTYTRIVVDEAGESHFAEAELPMTLASYAMPEPKVGLSATYEAASVTFFSAGPGYFGDWHTAIRKQFLFHLSGTAEIVVSDGESRTFKTGDILLVEDTTGKGHTARIVGDETVLIAAVPAVID